MRACGAHAGNTAYPATSKLRTHVALAARPAAERAGSEGAADMRAELGRGRVDGVRGALTLGLNAFKPKPVKKPPKNTKPKNTRNRLNPLRNRRYLRYSNTTRKRP